MTRRSYGTGSLYVRADSAGRESWYGQWRASGRRVKRCVGPVRSPGSRDGLTRPQAEKELRRLMAQTPTARPASERLTLGDVAPRYLAHLESKNRKRSTVVAAESCLRVWLLPVLGDRALDAIRGEDVEDLMSMMDEGKRPAAPTDGKRRTGRAANPRPCGPKTIRNYVGTLSAIYHYAMHSRRRWATSNPCDDVDLPEVEGDEDIRFLEPVECDALAAAARPGDYRAIDAAVYVAAPRTGLRHGEWIALRWRDVDWTAMRIRVRQNYVLGEFGTPKSRRSTRSVPMAAEVGGALERLFKQSRWQGDDDLVFADPVTGGPLSKAANNRRFRKVAAIA